MRTAFLGLALPIGLSFAGLSSGCAAAGQGATMGGDAGSDASPDASGPPGDGAVPPPKDAATVEACTGACDASSPPTCPSGTVLVDGQCDDLRCPDELPSAMPSAVGLPSSVAWPRFRHDNRNSGWTRAKVAAAPTVKWSKTIGLGVGPSADPQGHVFAGSETANAAQGFFDSFDASGNPVWSFLLGGNGVWDVTVPALLTNGTAYLSTDDVSSGTGELWAIAPNGAKMWSYPVPSVAEASPIVAHSGTLVYANDDHFYALDPMGNLLWETDPTAPSGSALGSNTGLAQTCDGHIYAGTPKGWRAIDVATGATLWSVPGGWTGVTVGAASSAPVVAADGTLYAVDAEGVGWAVDASGDVLWRKPIGHATGDPIASAKLGTLLLGIADGNLVALDAGTGAMVWMASGAFGAGPVIDGNMRIYVNTSNSVSAFDASGNSLWKLSLGSGDAGPSEMAIAPDGTIYVQTFDGASQTGSLWAIQ